MKKHYIILSILIAVFITFTVLTIVFFHEYKDITKEIVSKELSYDFTSLFPIGSLTGNNEENSTTLKERPDTSALSIKADNMEVTAIVFLVLAILTLAALIYYIIRMLKQKKTLVN